MAGPGIHVGSGAQSGVKIPDPAVSPTHYMIAFDGDSYFIVDEGGQGGTAVNGQRVIQPRRLSHGDVITAGKTRITFTLKHHARTHKEQRLEAGSHETVKTKTSLNGLHQKKKKDKKEVAQQPQLLAGSKLISSDRTQFQEARRKKNLKQPKEKKDERVKSAMVRAWGGIIATVLSVALTVVISMVVSRQGSTGVPILAGSAAGPDKKLANLSDFSSFDGGKYEASGAVAVPNTNGVLFVDDSEPDQVFYMPVNALGEQDGPVKPVPLGVSVSNPEGITQFGSRFMITGSLSTNESNDTGGIATFEFDPATQSASKAVVLTGMRKFLLDNVPELKAWASKTSIEGGLNIEGITADPDPQRLRVLLGLRGPVLNGNALVVSVRIVDRQLPLTVENLAMDEPNAIQLNLNGQAIRDIQYDSRLRAFLIISGAPETAEKTDFLLWQWNGEANQTRDEARPKLQSVLDKRMKPEGVAPLKLPNRDLVFLVGDASSYATIDYVSQ